MRPGDGRGRRVEMLGLCQCRGRGEVLCQRIGQVLLRVLTCDEDFGIQVSCEKKEEEEQRSDCVCLCESNRPPVPFQQSQIERGLTEDECFDLNDEPCEIDQSSSGEGEPPIPGKFKECDWQE